MQTLYTGGTVFHIFLGERLHSWKSAAELIRKVSSSSHLPYFTLTPTFSICSTHGYTRGEHKLCPICGAQSEVYSRVVGYLRPVDQWNDGKTEIDTTTGLKIDEYPDDPDRFKKESSSPLILIMIAVIVIFVVMVLILITGIAIFAFIRSRSKNDMEEMENQKVIKGCEDHDGDLIPGENELI